MRLGADLGDLGVVLGILERPWGVFGRSWGGLGLLLAALGRSWAGLGASLGRSWVALGRPRRSQERQNSSPNLIFRVFSSVIFYITFRIDFLSIFHRFFDAPDLENRAPV